MPEQSIFRQYLEKYAEFAFLSCFSSFISILPILLLSFIFLEEYQQDFKSFAIGLGLLTVYIIVSNMLVVATSNNKIYWLFVLGLMSFLVVTLYTEQAATFPKAIMRTYKLGNIKASSIVLDKQGCNILNQHLDIYDVPLEKRLKLNNDLCTLKDVYILSKLGKESYIEINVDTFSRFNYIPLKISQLSLHDDFVIEQLKLDINKLSNSDELLKTYIENENKEEYSVSDSQKTLRDFTFPIRFTLPTSSIISYVI